MTQANASENINIPSNAGVFWFEPALLYTDNNFEDTINATHYSFNLNIRITRVTAHAQSLHSSNTYYITNVTTSSSTSVAVVFNVILYTLGSWQSQFFQSQDFQPMNHMMQRSAFHSTYLCKQSSCCNFFPHHIFGRSLKKINTSFLSLMFTALLGGVRSS